MPLLHGIILFDVRWGSDFEVFSEKNGDQSRNLFRRRFFSYFDLILEARRGPGNVFSTSKNGSKICPEISHGRRSGPVRLSPVRGGRGGPGTNLLDREKEERKPWGHSTSCSGHGGG